MARTLAEVVRRLAVPTATLFVAVVIAALLVVALVLIGLAAAGVQVSFEDGHLDVVLLTRSLVA